jgi:hypothetical protein
MLSQWFQDSASTAFGSQFPFTQPFTIQGDAGIEMKRHLQQIEVSDRANHY